MKKTMKKEVRKEEEMEEEEDFKKAIEKKGILEQKGEKGNIVQKQIVVKIIQNRMKRDKREEK